MMLSSTPKNLFFRMARKVHRPTKNRQPNTSSSLFHRQHSSRHHPISTSSTSSSPFRHQLPKRIILLRHGESLGNVDETSYSQIPDWKIPLTRRGERQALHAAHELQHLLDENQDDDDNNMASVFCYCSPYTRTLETWKIMKEYLLEESKVEIVGTRQEPRIAEQQFGNFQNPHKVRTAKAERRTFGRFFFRFPNGEAGLDVYNRVSSFLATLSRDLHQIQQQPPERFFRRRPSSSTSTSSSTTQDTPVLQQDEESSLTSSSEEETDSTFSDDDDNTNTEESSSFPSSFDPLEELNIIIVTHGLTLRLLLMRYFQLSVEEFEQSYNSQNAKLVVMDRFIDPQTKVEYFQLDETAKEALNLKGDVSNQLPVYWRDGGSSGGGDDDLAMDSSRSWYHHHPDWEE